MRGSARTAVFLGLGWLVSGCGDGGGNDTPTPASACASAGAAYCAKLKECAPFYFEIGWGTVMSCETRIKEDCVADLGAKDNSQTPADLAACAGSVGGITCADLFSDNLPATCKAKPGPLTNGTPCGVDGQCASTHCKITTGTCGVCAARAAVGEACTGDDDDCVEGLTCTAGNLCAMPGAIGAPCDGMRPCRDDLSCRSGACAMPLGAGQACVAQADCDGLKGLWCNPLMRLCQMAALADPGQPCGAVGCPGTGCTFTACRNGGHCRTPAGGNAGTCVAAAVDGAACDDTNGPTCLAPAECLAGVCTRTDPASCR